MAILKSTRQAALALLLAFSATLHAEPSLEMYRTMADEMGAVAEREIEQSVEKKAQHLKSTRPEWFDKPNLRPEARAQKKQILAQEKREIAQQRQHLTSQYDNAIQNALSQAGSPASLEALKAMNISRTPSSMANFGYLYKNDVKKMGIPTTADGQPDTSLATAKADAVTSNSALLSRNTDGALDLGDFMRNLSTSKGMVLSPSLQPKQNSSPSAGSSAKASGSRRAASNGRNSALVDRESDLRRRLNLAEQRYRYYLRTGDGIKAEEMKIIMGRLLYQLQNDSRN